MSKRIFKYNEYITESTIGSEAIRTKYYPSLSKNIFYKLINIDPTSIRKKDFSKPGKYSKWLLKEFFKQELDKHYDLNNPNVYEYFTKPLNFKLFIFSTNWFKNKVKNNEVKNSKGLDILKYTYFDFTKMMSDKLESEYKKDTEDAKYDTLYSDDKITILIPLNFTASYETAKNTDWCSKSLAGYSMWNKSAILYRIIPKNSEYDKLKLTYAKADPHWYLASSKYPEISGNANVFIQWKESLQHARRSYYEEKYKPIYDSIEKTMSIISIDAQNSILNHYEKTTGNHIRSIGPINDN